jgi:hypothetical protein
MFTFDVNALTENDYDTFVEVRSLQYCAKSLKCRLAITFSEVGRTLFNNSPIYPYAGDTIIIDYTENPSAYKLEVRNASDVTSFCILSNYMYTYLRNQWYYNLDAPSADLREWFSGVINFIRYPIPHSLPKIWIIRIEPYKNNLHRIVVSCEKSINFFDLFNGGNSIVMERILPSYTYFDDKYRIKEIWNPKVADTSRFSGNHVHELYGFNCIYDDYIEIGGCQLPTTFTASDPNTLEVVMDAKIEYFCVNDDAGTEITFPDQLKLFATKTLHNTKQAYKRFVNQLKSLTIY